MINIVLYIMEHKHPSSYRLVITIPCLDLLLDEFHDFKLVVDYDPFEPAEEDIRIHGIWEAKKRARINTQHRCGRGPQRMGTWRGRLLSKCYRQGWPRDRARESNPELGHSSEQFNWL